MLDSLIEWGKDFVINYGLIGLFLISLTDSFIQPIPPDPMLATLEIFNFNPLVALTVALGGSLLGAWIGYFLGKKLGRPAGVKLFGKEKIKKAEIFFKKWGFTGVVLAAFTPIPFKIATWLAGSLKMNFWLFITSSFIGRGIRFVLIIFFIDFLFT